MIRRVSILIAFLLGMGNFAAQRAVLESGHPMLRALPSPIFPFARAASLALEFVLLVAAMLAVWRGEVGWLWPYAGYSLANGVAAWAIAKRRI